MRMTDSSHSMIRKRPLKAKRAAAIAKTAGRNQTYRRKPDEDPPDILPQHTPEISARMVPYLLPQTRGVLCKEFVMTAEQLGTGNFGVMWRCERLVDGTASACESVAKSTLVPGGFLTTLGTEIAILDLLRGHENIIQQHGVYEDVTQVHVVREMCNGGTLASLLQETKSFKEKEGAWLFRKIISAVNYCHTRIPAILHRNIRPENVLFTSGSKVEPKLADFSQSVTLSPGQLATGLVGTPYFMAPETVNQALYGTPADIWSLGVVLYVMLAGYLPFTGSSPKDVFNSILQGHVPFHTHPWPCISESCKALIRLMLSHKPQDRPTAAHILQHPWVLHLGPLHRPPYPPVDPLLSSAPPLQCTAHSLPGDSLSTYGTSPTQDSSFTPYSPPNLNLQLQTSTSAAAPAAPVDNHDSSSTSMTAQPPYLPGFGGCGHPFAPPPPPPPLFSAASAPSSFPIWAQDTYGEPEGWVGGGGVWSSYKIPVSGASAAEPCLPPQPTAAAAAAAYFPFPPQYPTRKEQSLELGHGLHRNLSLDLKFFDDLQSPSLSIQPWMIPNLKTAPGTETGDKLRARSGSEGSGTSGVGGDTVGVPFPNVNQDLGIIRGLDCVWDGSIPAAEDVDIKSCLKKVEN